MVRPRVRVSSFPFPRTLLSYGATQRIFNAPSSFSFHNILMWEPYRRSLTNGGNQYGGEEAVRRTPRPYQHSLSLSLSLIPIPTPTPYSLSFPSPFHELGSSEWGMGVGEGMGKGIKGIINSVTVRDRLAAPLLPLSPLHPRCLSSLSHPTGLALAKGERR